MLLYTILLEKMNSIQSGEYVAMNNYERFACVRLKRAAEINTQKRTKEPIMASFSILKK